MDPKHYFESPSTISQKQYEALRQFFLEGISGKQVAENFGYTYRGFTTIVSEFRKKLKEHPQQDPFFVAKPRGRKVGHTASQARELIVALRKKYYSVEDIKVLLDSKDMVMSEGSILKIIKEEGFARLPRRSLPNKKELAPPPIEAEKSIQLPFHIRETFKSSSAGILCLLPFLKAFGIDELIARSSYPETSSIDRVSSILSFVALKACNVRRYSADDLWCMDRGLGMFAGLNVLPKTAWFSSYSHRVTAEMNLDFLKHLHALWLEKKLLSDTTNLDFTAIPYWGEDDHLENNWSGKRGRALSSMLAVLAHDPESGIIDFGNTNVMHKKEGETVLEFLDFYGAHGPLKFLVFDSKFTPYENLAKLDDQNIKFITIRRRGKNIVNEIEQMPDTQWKKIRVETSSHKKRLLKVLDQRIWLKGYGRQIRQVVVTGHGKVKPALIITNEFDMKVEEVVRKYTRRWLVEKAISEQISFFHLNQLSSSIVVKVDFDLTMSILTHNLYRIFAMHMERYEMLTDQSLFQKFINNTAMITIEEDDILISLEKKRTLPVMIQRLKEFENHKYPWLGNKNIRFVGASNS